MKKLLLLISIVPSFALAEGPLFRHKDTVTQQEFENNYQDHRNFLSQSSNGVSILGTNTNNNASAGYVGEYISSTTIDGTSFPPSGQYGDLISIDLTAGDWDIRGCINANKNGGAATISGMQILISTTSGNSLGGAIESENLMDIYPPSDHNGTCIPSYRWSSNSSATMYLKYFASYVGVAPLSRGNISARRVR